MVEAALESPEAARLVSQVVRSRLMEETVTQLVDETAARLPQSEALWALIDEVAQSPAVTEAITESGQGLRRPGRRRGPARLAPRRRPPRTRDLAAAAPPAGPGRAARATACAVSTEPPLPPVTPRVGGANGAAPDGAAAAEVAATVVAARDAARPGYAGLATRGIAFAADAASHRRRRPARQRRHQGSGSRCSISLDSVTTVFAAAGAVAFLVHWMAGYFVVFWSTTGQTPGSRLMQIRVQNGQD